MRTAAADNVWEGESQDIAAQILAKRVRKEARLREIVGQSALSFFIGGSLVSGILRITGFIALIVLYVRSEASSSLTLWPILALGGFIEAYRANRRLDAMFELEAIAEASETLP